MVARTLFLNNGALFVCCVTLRRCRSLETNLLKPFEKCVLGGLNTKYLPLIMQTFKERTVETSSPLEYCDGLWPIKIKPPDRIFSWTASSWHLCQLHIRMLNRRGHDDPLLFPYFIPLTKVNTCQTQCVSCLPDNTFIIGHDELSK